MKKILQSREGIFPAARDLEFSCNCTRTFRMCSHVIATLYGVGMALDKDANRLFTLRGIGAENFLDQIERKKAERMLLRSRQKTKRAVDPKKSGNFFHRMEPSGIICGAELLRRKGYISMEER